MKPTGVGSIVRNLGAETPSLAGMEGYVVEVTDDSHAWGGGYFVRWAPFRASDVTHARASDVRTLKGFTKAFAKRYATPSFEEACSDRDGLGFREAGKSVRVRESHGSERFRGDVGVVEKYVPFGKYYVRLERNGRQIVAGEDLAFQEPTEVAS